MSVRLAIVEADLDGLNVTEFCRQHGISTWFFYDLRRRHAAGGVAAIEVQSRAPHHVRNRTPEELRDQIVALRKELEDLGLDAGPASIYWQLFTDDPRAHLPSEATIWRVLRERGFIIPAPHKAPKHAHRSFSASRANECWQIDATKWMLASGEVVEIINVIDDCTRVAVASVAVAVCTIATAWDALCRGAEMWGWPARVLSDNGAAFRGDTRAGGGGIEASLAALGIAVGHSRPYHPQTLGKVERFHQTLKKYLRACDPAWSLEELQAYLDAFVERYNRRRAHRSLGRRTPAAVWDITPKSGPASRALGTPTRVYRGKVWEGRVFLPRRRYAISIGARYNGEQATVVLTGVHAHVFVEGRLARSFTLDPERRYQTLPSKSRRLP
jgi:transposase InsO family protein